MRSANHIYALVAIWAVMVVTLPSSAQQSSQNDTDKNPPAQSGNQTQPADSTAKPAADDNAFPDGVSRKAAKAAEQQKKAADQPPAADSSPGHASDQTSQDSKPPGNAGGDDNAFPEETSRKAAADAKAAASGSGVSSSSDYNDRANNGTNSIEPNAAMPHVHSKDPAKEDIYVGTYYLQSGDFVGAYARFKEASTLHPENTDAMFGLAEAARHLKKNDEARENYRLFLDVVPSGSKAKDARKALASLEKPH